MNIVQKIALTFTIIGAINWGLVGLFDFNLVDFIFGAGSVVSRIIYTVVAILFYLLVYTLYAFIAAGKTGVIAYWKNIIPATVTSIATCSSAASIPVNTECAKKIGVPNDIAETTVPLGTSFHKAIILSGFTA